MIRDVEFRVAGVTHHVSNIRALATEPNEEYSRSNKELLEDYQDGDRIYKMEADISVPVELVPEPTNRYDPNAIKVVADGRFIGYIKKLETDRVRELLASPDFKGVRLGEICYGDVKLIVEDDDDPDKLTVVEDVHETPSVTIVIKVEQAEPEPASEPINSDALKPGKRKIMSILLLVIGLIFVIFGLLMLTGGVSAAESIFVIAMGLIVVIFSQRKRK